MASMEIQFRPFNPDTDGEDLARFLSSQRWPFHSNQKVTYESALSFVRENAFHGEDTQTYWILDSKDAKLGVLKLFEMDDLEDGSPLFDLRLLNQFQGNGVGEKAVRWLTEHLFTNHPSLRRIEGTTRADNKAMRSVFRKCGYVKEGHYRLSWPADEGRLVDTVRYAVLRKDWESGSQTEVNWEDE